MKSKVFSALLLLSSLSLMAQDNAPIVQHQDGLFANASAVSNDTSVFAVVSRGSALFTGQATTFIFFDMITFTPDGFTDTSGVGTIPNDAIKGDDPAHVVLDIDLSQLTTVSGATCTFNIVDSTQNCSPTPLSGVIHLEWRQTKLVSIHATSTFQQTFFQFQINSQVESDSSSAAATGSLLGFDMSNGNGQVGVNHASTMVFLKVH
jgi:hypothetical protein